MPERIPNGTQPAPDEKPGRWRSLARAAAYGGKLATTALRLYRMF